MIAALFKYQYALEIYTHTPISHDFPPHYCIFQAKLDCFLCLRTFHCFHFQPLLIL